MVVVQEPDGLTHVPILYNVHAADVVKVTRKLEESHLAGTGCQIAVTLFLLGTLSRLLGLLNAADRLRAEERRPGPDPRC